MLDWAVGVDLGVAGRDVAALLEAVAVDRLCGPAAERFLHAQSRLAARAAARTAQAVTVVAAQAEREARELLAVVPARWRPTVEQPGREVVALACRVSPITASTRLEEASRLCAPERAVLWQELAAGRTTVGHMFLVGRELAALPVGLPARVLGDARVVVSLREDVAGETARLVRRVVAGLDPDALADTEQSVEHARDARVRTDRDGRHTVIAPTTGADAEALQALFEAAVTAARVAGDARTAAQVRHDVLLDAAWQGLGLAGRPDMLPVTSAPAEQAEPVTTPAPATDGAVLLGLTLSLDSLLGGEAPGALDRGGVLSADLSRHLASLASRVRLLVHDDDGRLVYATPDYRFTRPAARTARLARCGRCTFPGCRRDGLDLDHAVPYGEGGQTSLDNAVPACRRHHNLKTHHRWRTGLDTRTGEITWSSPGWASGRTRPPDRLPITPLPPWQREGHPCLPVPDSHATDPPPPVASVAVLDRPDPPCPF